MGNTTPASFYGLPPWGHKGCDLGSKCEHLVCALGGICLPEMDSENSCKVTRFGEFSPCVPVQRCLCPHFSPSWLLGFPSQNHQTCGRTPLEISVSPWCRSNEQNGNSSQAHLLDGLEDWEDLTQFSCQTKGARVVEVSRETSPNPARHGQLRASQEVPRVNAG